ncbi:MAG: TIGR04086 family membrane protein [Firmicutes bacterium]|nr:TIGR04086 family membrane protein [Bacillota bacterium]MCL1953631.1 TIGR04086 family membrane protein [Bacillota bacterium]
MTTQSSVRDSSSSIIGVLRGVLFALVVALALVLGFGLLVWFFEVSTDMAAIINQVIKGVSIFVGCLIGIRGTSNGWVKGFFVGVLFIIVAFLLFSALDQTFEVGMNLVNDIALGGVFGLASGVICANMGRK